MEAAAALDLGHLHENRPLRRVGTADGGPSTAQSAGAERAEEEDRDGKAESPRHPRLVMLLLSAARLRRAEAAKVWAATGRGAAWLAR